MKKIVKKFKPFILKGKSQAGFTLIELLVVIGIIAVLATIGTISFGNAAAKSRNAKRQADLRTLSSGMQIFFVNKGYFPGTAEVSDWADLLTNIGVGGTYPAKSGDYYCYYVDDATAKSAQKYMLVATDMETKTMPSGSVDDTTSASNFIVGIKADGTAVTDATATTACPLSECMKGGGTIDGNDSYCILGGSTTLEETTG